MSYIGKIPANAALTASDLADGIVSTDKLAADAVVTSKITDGTIAQADISNQAINEAKMQISNAPTNGYMLTAQSGNTGGLTWAAAPGGNTPAFFVHLGSTQTGTGDNSYGRVNCNTEVYDSGSVYDNSSDYKFTPGVSGKYYLFGNIRIDGAGDGNNDLYAAIYKNGSLISEVRFHESDQLNEGNIPIQTIVDSDTDDYFQLYGKSDVASGTVNFIAGTISTYFGGFKI